MGIFGNIILGLLIIGAGILILKYNYQVSNSLRISFAEQHMGSGGSYTLWKILGIFIVIGGLTVIFGIYDEIIGFILSPVTNALDSSK